MDFSKKTLVELREIAKEKGLKGITALRKPELIQRLTEVSEETKRDDAFPKGLYLRNADGILWLHGYAYDPAYRFSGADLFAFEKISSPSSN